jgi:hypothetical protein
MQGLAMADDEHGQDGEGETWYVRRGPTIKGPYDVATLRRYLLLGRVRVTDRVSANGYTWQPLTQRGELIPQEMRDLGSPEGRARFEAARSAVDERSGSDDGDDGDDGWRWPPRRRQTDAASRIAGVRILLSGLAVTAVAVLVAIGYQDVWLHGPAGPPDCSAEAAAGINWSYCTKDAITVSPRRDLSSLRAVNASMRNAGLAEAVLRDATLAYADLTGADLRGAILEGADLEGAVLREADLRDASLRGARLNHADLRNARIEGADFGGADLNSVVWPDDFPCHQVAIDACPD